MSMHVAAAIVIDGFGGPEQMRITESPVPVPGEGEVLVRVVTAAVTHMDAYVSEGRFEQDVPLTFPARLGSGFAGIVQAVGPGVRGLARHAEVLGHDPAHGAYATHVVVPADAVVRKPTRVTWEVAAALHLSGSVAYSLVLPLRLSDRDVVVVTAAAGGVGHLECQLAHLAGATVIGIAGRENHDYLRSIGVRPVARDDADLVGAIRKAADGDALTALLDNFGGYESLAEQLQVPRDRVVSSDARRDVEVEAYTTGADRAVATRLADVAELVSSWNIRLLVSGFYPFTEIRTAFADLGVRHSRGVVVVGMDPAAPPREYLRGKLRARYEAGG